MRNLRRNWKLGLLVLYGAAVGSPSANAQAAKAPQTPQHIAHADLAKATRIVTLGTAAGPRSLSDRAGPATLLQVGDRIYLIDAGAGVSHGLAKIGIQPDQVRRIFLTHLHFDHVAGISTLLGFAWQRRPSNPIEIYGPPATHEYMTRATNLVGFTSDIYAAEMPPTPPVAKMVVAHDVDVSGPMVIYKDDLIKVTAVENSHYATIPADRRPLGAARSYAYRFDTPDRSIVFTGDTGPSEAVTQLARGADILVAEVMEMDYTLSQLSQLFNTPVAQLRHVAEHMLQEHLSPQAVGEMAKRAGVGMVVLSHIGTGENNHDLRLFTSGVRAAYPGPVVAANDGDAF
ncbi:MBL fold metallo-hydrolase [Sphingobium sp. B2]|uniref:MBL fold metallo-hydrolase n=1 Tax=Sphingobium sp. B2 TaxID=2583228 RepID=UPI001643F5E4|nr:MBL fold metallo-hydrolase [Sphingobium sp. B2]